MLHWLHKITRPRNTINFHAARHKPNMQYNILFLVSRVPHVKLFFYFGTTCTTSRPFRSMSCTLPIAIVPEIGRGELVRESINSLCRYFVYEVREQLHCLCQVVVFIEVTGTAPGILGYASGSGGTR